MTEVLKVQPDLENHSFETGWKLLRTKLMKRSAGAIDPQDASGCVEITKERVAVCERPSEEADIQTHRSSRVMSTPTDGVAFSVSEISIQKCFMINFRDVQPVCM